MTESRLRLIEDLLILAVFAFPVWALYTHDQHTPAYFLGAIVLLLVIVDRLDWNN